MQKRILLVEDDRLSREAMTNVLEQQGYEVLAAESNEDAWQKVSQGPVDVVLVDIGLPGLSGDSFASYMHLKHPKTRIIFISGEYTMVDLERFGPQTRFFPKPVDPVMLIDALQN